MCLKVEIKSPLYVMKITIKIYIYFKIVLFSVKSMGAAKAYLFRVLSHSTTSYSISDELKYDLPENVKRRAVTAGTYRVFHLKKDKIIWL